MKIVYFAWVRQKIGKNEEEFLLPTQVSTVSELIGLLRARGDGYSEIFSDPARIRVAVNCEHANLDAKLENRDEVAFFPPVTGG